MSTVREGVKGAGVASRRDVLRLAGAAALVGARLPAAPPPPEPSAESRYVIDGNLIPPIDDEQPLPVMIATQVRSAGLTALKLTVGGSGNQDRKAATEELHVFERSLTLNPQLGIVKLTGQATMGALSVLANSSG